MKQTTAALERMAPTYAPDVVLVKSATTITIWPLVHYGAGVNPTRRTWSAALSPTDDTDTVVQWCAHHAGHRTVAAAKDCGRAMWRKLASEREGVVKS